MNKETSVYLDDFWSFNLISNEFRQINNSSTPIISKRGSHSIICDREKKKIYIFGGKNETERMNDLYEYDITSNKLLKVESLSNPPTKRCNHTAMIYKRSMIIFGGWDGTRTLNDMYELSLSKLKISFISPNIKIDRYNDLVSHQLQE